MRHDTINMNGNSNCYISSKEISNFNQIKTSKTNLYIKGLHSNFTDEDILNLAPDRTLVKSVKAAIEDDKKCKGYGFIDFLTPEDAIIGLEYIQERHPNFTIKFAKENEKDKTNLYITNLPKSWTSKDSEKLKSIFEKYGEIQSAFIMLEKYANKPLGVGFVRFFHEESAQLAINDLESNHQILSEDSTGPLEAKYADKHNTDSRRKHSILKSGINGKLQSSNQLPLLTSPNGTQMLTAIVDNGYFKGPLFSGLSGTANTNDVYNQYVLNFAAQSGFMDPYYLLPAVLAPPSPVNYLGSYGDNPSSFGSYYSNLFYPIQNGIQGWKDQSPICVPRELCNPISTTTMPVTGPFVVSSPGSTSTVPHQSLSGSQTTLNFNQLV